MSLSGSSRLVPYQRLKFMSARALQLMSIGLNALVRRSCGLPPEATMVPSARVDRPAQNMSWKLLSASMKVSVAGSNTEACVYSRLDGKRSVSVDDQVRMRPSGKVAAEMAISGHGMTLPHSPMVARSAAVGGAEPLFGSGRKDSPGGATCTSSTSPPPRSKKSTTMSCSPAARLMLPVTVTGACRPSLSTTTVPLTSTREPSSERERNWYCPAAPARNLPVNRRPKSLSRRRGATEMVVAVPVAAGVRALKFGSTDHCPS